MSREWVILGLPSDKIQKSSKQDRERCRKQDARPERRAKKAQSYQENKEQIKEKRKEYYQRPETKLRHSTGCRKKYQEDPIYRLKIIRSRQLRQFIKSVGGTKTRRTEELLGYTAEELKTHLESLFKDGMTWENQGKWHIDHRIPQSYFTSIDQLKECFALDNLKPEWGSWNMRKGNRFIG